MKVLVVGAGLSGLSAALELARAGVAVTLAERRPFAGGRTYSFAAADGDELDNGQHVFLGCCTAYRQFLRDIGAEGLVHFQRRARVKFIDGRTGRASTVSEWFLPSPYHFLPSVLRYKPLSWRERLAALRCGREILATDPARWEDASMGEWLRAHGQTDNAIRNFWGVAVLAILNEDVDRVSAAQAMFVIREGFSGGRAAARVGWAKVGLGRIAEKAVEAIRAAGGTIRLGEKVERLEGHDAYVPAVPAKALLELLAPGQREMSFFAPLKTMETSPIVNLHVRFDRPVWNEAVACFVASPLQWVFNRSKITGQSGGGTRLTISVSGARDLMELMNEEIERRYVAELRRLLPDAREAIVKRFTVVREPDATFVPAPGRRGQRLPCETPIPNVFLAGEWTESEWPSTMEAAVRSGARAAKAVLRAEGARSEP